jgi:hypothetical protein
VLDILQKRRALLAAGFAALLLGGWCGPALYGWHHRLKAMNTLGNLRSPWVVCESSTANTAAEVYAECRRIGASCNERDGWGRPYEFEIRAEGEGRPRCLVRSLGRDARRSACCQKDAGWCWDLDAVYDGEWRQVWDTMRGGNRVTCPEL